MYKNKSALLFCLFVLSAATLKASTPIYRDVHATPAARTADLLSQMTLDEKLDLLSGDSTGFATKAVPRLGIPSIKMSDGPLGVRIGKATAFPSGILMGATFNPEIIGKVSSSIANEAKANGRNMLLGPCIDISRNPFGGRNFESFGEDPYLTSRMAESYVQGVQKEGVLASTKHFAMNDQEFKRTEINVIADERTMHEVHLPAFQAAVNAGTATVMASYNKLNGFWAAENPTLLTDILVKQWGFKGWVVSDWGATHSTANALNAGLAVEMPTPQFFTKNLLMQALNSRQVQASVVDDRVSRILFSMFNSGIFDADPSKYPDRSTIGDEEHRAVALKAAQEGIVLLKNDSAVLPLKKNIQHIAVIGPGAFYARTGGGGSSMVDPTRVVTSLEAMKTQFGEAVRYEKGIHMKGDFEAVPAEYWSLDPQGKTRGLNAEYWSNKTLSGTPALTRVEKTLNFDWQDKSPDPSIPVDGFSARWTSYLSVPVSGDYALAMMSDDGARVYVDDQLVFNSWHNQAADVQEKNMHLDGGRQYKIVMEYYEDAGAAVAGFGILPTADQDLQMAVKAAAESDVAVVFAGLSSYFESEGRDRTELGLPQGQDDLIHQIAKVNPHTIVVINAGNPVLMPWLNEVQAVVYAWYPGQEGGTAIADVLAGKINPSGKLPVSFPKSWQDHPAYGHYPEDPGVPGQVTYAEGVYVGYRYYDTHKVDTLFPFGFGLSYSQFTYRNLKISVQNAVSTKTQMQVSFDLSNTSKVDGSEVAELYVQPQNPKIDRPFQELKAFKKIALKAGETQHVTFDLDAMAFSYYDVSRHDWQSDIGSYGIVIGRSSRDDKALKGSVTLQ